MTLIHLHIPKTAGTTLLSILEKNYPNLHRLSNTRGWINPNIPNKADCISGHMPFASISVPNPEYITFVRHPITRLMSFYYYVCNRPMNEWHSRVKPLTLSQFLKSNLHNNEMVRLIAGVEDISVKITALHLDIAIANLETFSFVGITENTNKEIEWMAHKYNWQYRPIVIPYKLATKNKGYKTLPRSDFLVAKKKTEYDLALYHWVLEKKSANPFWPDDESISST